MLIALDIGTTHVKAVAFSDAGLVLHSVERINQSLVPKPGFSEQLPEKVFQNVLDALKEVLQYINQNFQKDALRGIVFSSAMHGLVSVDENGLPLSNFLLWSDTRADNQARDLRQKGGGGQELYKLSGVPIHPMSPLLKLIWLRQNQPEVFQKAHKFLGIKEFVWHRLTGKYESDLSCASATGLMHILKNEWDDLAMATAGISRDRLPILVSPTHVSISTSVFLPKNIPLIIGASDGALANLGSGATQPGQLAVTIGTSAAIRVLTQTPLFDEQMRTFCYRLDESCFIVGGASNNGTNAMEWLRTSVLQSQLSPEAFANQALTVPTGADGLRFYPYLYGERAPVWDASARASFVGLTAEHTQAHFVRAVMEGVLHNLKSVADVLEEKMQIQSLHASGGFTKNELWVSMLADIFQKKVMVNVQGGDASVRGAFLMGKAALGVI